MEFAGLTVLRTSLLLAAAWTACLALGRASAALRHLVWVLAVAAVLLAAPAALVAPRWEVAPSALAVVDAVPAAAPAAVAVTPASVPPAAGRTPWWALLWAAGVTAVTGRFAAGSLRVRRLAARCDAAGPAAQEEMHQLLAAFPLRRSVRVVEGAGVAVPMTWGLLRPLVMLPAGSGRWPAGRLRSVLLHELVHIRRFDLLTGIAAQLACAVYWFNPLMWAAAGRLRRERERSCDDAVLRTGVAAPDYAGHLVDLVRQMRAGRHGNACAPAMAEGADLEGRVRALLDRGRSRSPVTVRVAAAAAVLAALLVLPLVAIHARAQGARGAIAGVVKDASGATVPRCAVTARNRDGKNVEAATTTDTGDFAFTAIPAGRYLVEFRARGFKATEKEVTVEAGQTARAEVTVPIGGVAETVVVTGKRPQTPPPAPTAPPRRIRVGGNVQATKLLKMQHPAYPAELQQAGVEGVVLLRAVIALSGELLNLEVANTGVHPGLAQAALDAVRQWRYQPTLLNGQPVEVVTTITVEFRLEK